MASTCLPHIPLNANQSSSRCLCPRKFHRRLLPASPFLTLISGFQVSISTALGTRSDRRTSGRRQQSPNSAPGHQYFLRSSAKMKSPTVSASSETPHTPLPKRYKPLELAKMSVEARMALREEKIIPKENASARDIAEGTHLCFFHLVLFPVSLGLTMLSLDQLSPL